MTLVLASDAIAVKLALGMEIEMSPAVSPWSEFRVSPDPDPEVEAPPGAMDALTVVGSTAPKVRSLSRLTSITKTLTRTSDLGLSISSRSFWARTI